MLMPNKQKGGGVILLTLLIALYLAILPIPAWAAEFRPPWASLVLIYWCLATPERVGVLTAWFLGLTLDSLTGAMLGENALAMSVIAYICLHIFNRVRVFPLWQQALIVFSLLLLQYMISFWTRSSLGHMPVTFLFWVPPVVGALIWPWLFVILRDIRRRFNVAR